MDSLRINEKIAEAMDKLIERRLIAEAFDKTVVGKIITIIDSSLGKYKVEIDNILYEAQSLDTSKKYEKDNLVYIKIPQGNLEMRKFIEGLAANEEQIDVINSFLEATPKFEFISENNEIIGMTSQEETQNIILWSSDEIDNTIKISNTEIQEDFQNIFNFMLTNSEYLKFQVQVSTKFLNPQPDLDSNYGLQFNFINEENEIKTIFLDVLKFNIQPWQYTAGYYPQFLRIKTEELEGYRLNSISMFQNFLFKDELNYKEKNILFKNIEIIFENQFLQTEEENKSEYTMNLKSQNKKYDSSGIIEEFFQSKDSITIEAQILDAFGRDVSKEETYKYYWYKEAIPTESKFNVTDELAGPGWVNIPQISSDIMVTLDNEKTAKKKNLYDGEINKIKRKYKINTYDYEKNIWEVNERFGVTSNNVQIMPNSSYRNHKIIITKKDEKNQEVKILEKNFIVVQNDENLNLYNNLQIFIKEDDNSLILGVTEIPTEAQVYWKVEIYNENRKKIKTVKGFREETELQFDNIDEFYIINYTAYIYLEEGTKKHFFKAITGNWSKKNVDNNEVATVALLG